MSDCGDATPSSGGGGGGNNEAPSAKVSRGPAGIVPQSVRERVRPTAVDDVHDGHGVAGTGEGQPRTARTVPRVLTPPAPRRSSHSDVGQSAKARSDGDAPVSGPRMGAEEPNEGDVIDVIDVLDSDEEVRAAKSQSRRNNPLKAPEVDLTKFELVFVVINADKIIEPALKVRCVEESHVKTMQKKLKDDGYIGSSGSISIALKDADRMTPAAVEEILRTGVVNVEVWLVDGRHRLIAIKRLAVDSRWWAAQAKKLKVGLWLPKDDRHHRVLSLTEILNLGAYLNNSSSTNRAMSFQDQIHACVSLAKLLDKGEGVDIQTTSSSALASALCVGKTLGDQKMRQLQRYAQVALKLAQQDALFKVFIEETKDEAKLSLTHMSSDVLLGFEVDAFRLGIQCVKARIFSERDGKAFGKFEPMAREFYTLVGLMYQEVVKAARFKNKSVSNMMKKIVVVNRDDSFTVSENISLVMSRFKVVTNAGSADQRRVNNLKKHLKALVGDYEAGRVDETDLVDENRRTSSPHHQRADGEGEEEGHGSHSSGGDAMGESTTARAPEARSSSAAFVPRSPSLRSKGRSTRPTTPVVPQRTPRPKRGTPSVRHRKRRYEKSDSEFEVDVPEPPVKKRRVEKGTDMEESNAGVIAGLVRRLSRMSHRDIGRAMNAVRLDVVPQDEDVGALEGEEDGDESSDGGGQKFDDTVPTDLPIGYDDPTPYEGSETPEWCQYARRLPSQWPTENPIEHPQPFLEALFIPHEHRGNIFIRDAEVLKRNHHLVFWRAAHNYLHAHKEEIPVVRQGEPSGNVSDGSASKWFAAHGTDYLAKVYFAGKRQELETQGYCVLENFLDDGRVPESVAAPVGEDKDMFKKLRAFVSSSFPGELAVGDPGNRKIWNWIVNDGRHEVDDGNGRKGIGRYITSNVAVTRDVEQSQNKCWVAVSRALLDLRIAQVMSGVVPWDNTNPAHEKMFVPNTGGRWLLTGKKCQRQTLHTDFPTMSRSHVVRGTKNPGYFTVATGEMEVPLWVCPYSHKTVAMASENSICALSRGSIAGRVRIPPYSIFAGRGDVFHGGAAARDSSMDDGDLRYHLYFVPQNHALPNAVHLMSKFKPVFRKNLEDSTDEDGYDGDAESDKSEVDESTPLRENTDQRDNVDDVDDDGERRGTGGDDVAMEEDGMVIPGTQESGRRKKANVTRNADDTFVPDTAEQGEDGDVPGDDL